MHTVDSERGVAAYMGVLSKDIDLLGSLGLRKARNWSETARTWPVWIEIRQETRPLRASSSTGPLSRLLFLVSTCHIGEPALGHAARLQRRAADWGARGAQLDVLPAGAEVGEDAAHGRLLHGAPARAGLGVPHEQRGQQRGAPREGRKTARWPVQSCYTPGFRGKGVKQ